MENHQFKLLLIVFSMLCIFTGAVVLRSGKTQKAAPSFAAPAFIQNPIVTPKPSPAQPVIVESPDGKVTLTLDKRSENGNTLWILSADGKQILTETLPTQNLLSIPFNTFSPDNRYIFLKETGPGLVSYPVLTTNGSPITKSDQTVEISSLFSQKYPNYTITDVTGWGGMSLIVVNTDKAGGGQGPSFWFDVGSHSFIQLSTRFN